MGEAWWAAISGIPPHFLLQVYSNVIPSQSLEDISDGLLAFRLLAGVKKSSPVERKT